MKRGGCRRAPGCDAEVGELDEALLGGEDVGALDVAVDHALRVQVAQPLQHLPSSQRAPRRRRRGARPARLRIYGREVRKGMGWRLDSARICGIACSM